MANIVFGGLMGRSSVFYGIDGRVKLLLLVLHNYGVLGLDGAGLLVIGVGVFLLFWLGGIGLGVLFSGVKLGVYFCVFVLLLQLLSVGDVGVDVLFSFSFVELSYGELLYVFRLFLLLLSGQLLVSSSSLLQISGAVDSFFQYVPFFRRFPFGWMLRLSWSFFPTLYYTAKEVEAAQRSRLLVAERGFGRYVRCFTQSFVSRCVKKTFDITLAMQSRGFVGKPQPISAGLRSCDFVALLVFLVWHFVARYGWGWVLGLGFGV